MTNDEKAQLISFCKQGYTFSEIKIMVNCADTTIRRYMKIFWKKCKVRP